jgi:hypothetical protein
MKDLQSIGFKINSHSFANAKKHGREVGAGKSVLPPNLPPSKKPITPETKEKIENFLHKHSRIAANRTVSSTRMDPLIKKKQKRVLGVREFERNIKLLYNIHSKIQKIEVHYGECFCKNIQKLKLAKASGTLQ